MDKSHHYLYLLQQIQCFTTTLPPTRKDSVLLCLLDEEMGLCENLQKASLLWANTASCYNIQLVVSTLEFNPHLPFPLKRHGYPSLEGYL